jgi:hypothetical protein
VRPDLDHCGMQPYKRAIDTSARSVREVRHPGRRKTTDGDGNPDEAGVELPEPAVEDVSSSDGRGATLQ